MDLNLGLSNLGASQIGAIATGPIRDTIPSVAPGDAQQDTLETATAGTYSARGGGTVSITLQEWLVDGMQVATGLTYTPVVGDVGGQLVYREVATETGGTAPGAISTPVPVGIVAPDVTPGAFSSAFSSAFNIAA